MIVGDGPATKSRIELLKESHVSYDYYATQADFLNLKPETRYLRPIIFIADFDNEVSKELYDHAKSFGALVNVEDKAHLCDFNVPARVRRGDLLLTVSTSGASPRVARRLRTMLEQLFPDKWASVLADIKVKRTQWKAAGDSFDEVGVKTDALLEEAGLMEAECACLRAWKEAA